MSDSTSPRLPANDPCTLSNYQSFDVKLTELDLTVSFDSKIVFGSVTYHLTGSASEVVLDTSFLDVKLASVNGQPAEFSLASRIEPYGSPLTVKLPQETSLEVVISFSTTQKCTALQFIEGKTAPFLFSQCQAIHARSLFPCFDTPGCKSKYVFTVRLPYVSLMSGVPQPSDKSDVYHFKQDIPVPSYLVALASGDLTSLPTGPRSAVYAEKHFIQQSHWEFEKDTESFIQVAEKLLFEYKWLRFDMLVLPLSFPYGGMENPNITFVTPTLVGGDRSQVRVVAHELAHLWLGNLVTNASWEHFWLNEGWTVYIERRLIGAVAAKEAREQGKSQPDVYGEQVRQFAAITGWSALENAVRIVKPEFTQLVIDMAGQDPDDLFSRVPYEKGFFFLFYLENLFGLERFDKFIKFYFTKFQFRSLDSFQFKDTVFEFFREEANSIDWHSWFYGQGMPPLPSFDTTLVDVCYALADEWVEFAEHKLKQVTTDNSTFDVTQHVLFLETLAERLSRVADPKVAVDTFIKQYPEYATSANTEIKSIWHKLVITHGGLDATSPIVIQFAEWLGEVGRMKYVRPGYVLLRDYIGPDFARRTYESHQHKYHPICRAMVTKDLTGFSNGL